MEYRSRFYISKTIVNNHDYLIKFCEDFHKVHQETIKGSSTWTYKHYNFFNFMYPTHVLWSLLEELKSFVHSYLEEHNEPTDNVWMASWLNFHMPDEVLDWHTHLEVKFHGYMSIRPHNTRTLFFENDEVGNNEVGMVYIGPGDNFHKVEVIEPFDTPRITVAFDIVNGNEEYQGIERGYGIHFIPLV